MIDFSPFRKYILYIDVDKYMRDVRGSEKLTDKERFDVVIKSGSIQDKSDNPQNYKINAYDLFVEMRELLYQNGYSDLVDEHDNMYYDALKKRKEHVDSYSNLAK